MAINDKLLVGATEEATSSIDPRNHFGTVLWTGNSASDASGTTQSINGGKYDAAADFTANNAKINFTNPISMASATDMTFSIWIYFKTAPGTSGFLYGLMGRDSSSNYTPFAINLYGNSSGGPSISFERYYSSTQRYSTSYATVGQFDFSTDTWYHLAIVYTGSSNSAQVYVNGSTSGSSYTLDYSSSRSTTNTTSTLGVYDSDAYPSSYNFDGYLDQMRIYDTALSASDVSDLASETYADSYKINFPTGQTAKILMRFNGNANDETGSYDGTASNVTWKYGVNFNPDVIWLKKRSDNTSADHMVFDTSRGPATNLNFVYPNGNWAESAGGATYLIDTNTGGFQVGGSTYVNKSSETYVAWCWKVNGGTTASDGTGDITSTVQVNDDAGISIVTYTTNGSSSARVGHGLSTTPKAVLIKNRSATGSWHFMTTAIDGSFDDLILDDTGVKSDSSLTAPTSTTFASESGASSNTRVAYCIHDVNGYQKIGSYTGNGSANGPLVETGFKVGWIMIKRTDSSGDPWAIFDNQRSQTNPRSCTLRANVNDAENCGTDKINFYDDGFQPITNWSGFNASAGTYLYWAIASPPETTTPVLADSFNIKTWTGNGTYPPHADGSDDLTIGTDFAPNFVWGKVRTDTISHILLDSVRGDNKQLSTNSTDAQDVRDPDTKPNAYKFLSNGFSVNTWGNLNNAEDYVGYVWKASDSTDILTAGNNINSLVSVNDDAGFSIVKWTGDGNASSTVAHGLSTAPSVIILKDLDNTRSWQVYHSSAPASYKPYGGNLEGDAAFNTSAGSNGSLGTPTSSVITFTNGSSTINNCNASGANIVAYCWRPISNFSHFGSYTGTGTASSNAITGLGFQPDLVIYKAATRQGDWLLFDSVRGAQKRLRGNADSAESNWGTGGGLQSFDTDGFTVSTSDNTYSSNVLNETYVYMAFKMN